MTESQVMAKVIEVAPWTVTVIAGPGRTQTGDEFAKTIATEGRRVRFLRWPGGMTVAVTYPATQSGPNIHQVMHAFRESVAVPRGAGHA